MSRRTRSEIRCTPTYETITNIMLRERAEKEREKKLKKVLDKRRNT